MKISTHARNSPLISTKAKRRNGNAFSGVKSSLHWFLYCKEYHFRRGWGVLFLTWSQFFKREKELYVLNVPNLLRLSFKIRPNPARKHSTYIINFEQESQEAFIRQTVAGFPWNWFFNSRLSTLHSKYRKGGAFCFTAISICFLRPRCFLVVCRWPSVTAPYENITTSERETNVNWRNWNIVGKCNRRRVWQLRTYTDLCRCSFTRNCKSQRRECVCVWCVAWNSTRLKNYLSVSFLGLVFLIRFKIYSRKISKRRNNYWDSIFSPTFLLFSHSCLLSLACRSGSAF